MPRKPKLITLPMEKPDSCAQCPLLGLIPKEERPKGSKETHVCLGTSEALSGRGITVKASRKDKNHPLRRPCDSRWDAWIKFTGRAFPLNTNWFIRYRVPYEQSLQMTIHFHR